MRCHKRSYLLPGTHRVALLVQEGDGAVAYPVNATAYAANPAVLKIGLSSAIL